LIAAVPGVRTRDARRVGTPRTRPEPHSALSAALGRVTEARLYSDSRTTATSGSSTDCNSSVTVTHNRVNYRHNSPAAPALPRSTPHTVAAMRRLLLTSSITLVAFLVLVPPAWGDWVWPLRGDVITPYRNGSDPYASGQHRGIDIAGALGTAVVAATSGEVRFAAVAGSSGLTVSVRTADGRYDTSYLHLSSTAVRRGDLVAAGELVGTVGTSGTRSAAAPHVHFGVRDAGSRHAYHDPLGFLPPPAATQPPRGAPAPQPAPAPVAPAPAPVRAPAPSPRRVPTGAPRPVPLPVPNPRRIPRGAPRHVPQPAPSPRRVPANSPRQAPVGAPRRAPAGAPRQVPSGAPQPVSAEAPRLAPHPIAGPTPARAQAEAAAPNPRPTPAIASERAGAPPEGVGGTPAVTASNAAPGPFASPGGRRHQPEPASSPGPDLGLLAACLGLVAAAAILGLTRDGQKTRLARTAARATRHRVARVLQPMLGRQ
jgi:Peptidase family M23